MPAEREALAALRRGDILGLDVYRSIGWLDENGVERIGRALDDQLDHVRRWQRIAAEFDPEDTGDAADALWRDNRDSLGPQLDRRTGFAEPGSTAQIIDYLRRARAEA